MKDFAKTWLCNARYVFGPIDRRDLAFDSLTFFSQAMCIAVALYGWMTVGDWLMRVAFWVFLVSLPAGPILVTTLDTFSDMKRPRLTIADLKDIQEVEEHAKRGMREAWAKMNDPEYREWEVMAPKDPEDNSLGGSC